MGHFPGSVSQNKALAEFSDFKAAREEEAGHGSGVFRGLLKTPF